MIFPYYYPEISLLDFFILATIELLFLWFLLKQYSLRELLPSIIAINLIRIGVIQLLLPYITPTYDIYYHNYSSYPFLIFSIIFVTGVIFSTIIYEKEQWAVTREAASSLAFKVSAISTLIWLPLRLELYPPIYLFRAEFTDYMPVLANLPQEVTSCRKGSRDRE